MLGAVVYSHEQSQIAINAIHELVRDAGKPVWDWKAEAKDEALIAKVGGGWPKKKLRAAYKTATNGCAPKPAAGLRRHQRPRSDRAGRGV